MIPAHVAAKAATRTIPDGDCLLSVYSRNSAGVSQIGWTGATTTAARAAWVHYTGEQPTHRVFHIRSCKHPEACVKRQHLTVTHEQERDSRGRYL